MHIGELLIMAERERDFCVVAKEIRDRSGRVRNNAKWSLASARKTVSASTKPYFTFYLSLYRRLAVGIYRYCMK